MKVGKIHYRAAKWLVTACGREDGNGTSYRNLVTTTDVSQVTCGACPRSKDFPRPPAAPETTQAPETPEADKSAIVAPAVTPTPDPVPVFEAMDAAEVNGRAVRVLGRTIVDGAWIYECRDLHGDAYSPRFDVPAAAMNEYAPGYGPDDYDASNRLDDAWKRAEGEIWAGTGTDVRTRPRSFRKVKNTRSARARRGGAR